MATCGAPSGDRGLFKTIDGGKTWQKLQQGLPSGNRAGANDLVMDPADPKTLYVSFYQRLRRPYRFDSGGPDSGLFKSTDAGKSWRRLTRGCPAVTWAASASPFTGRTPAS